MFYLNSQRVRCFIIVLALALSSTLLADDGLHSEGQQFMDKQNWDAAIRTFDKIIVLSDGKDEAAVYWLAYSQFKSNNLSAALATIAKFRKDFSGGRWLDDLNALQVEIQDKRGDANVIDDDELKLYAINSLLNTPSDRAVALLVKIIDGDSDTKLKRRALFVLSQMHLSESTSIIGRYAKTEDDSELKRFAIKMLGQIGSDESATILADIYRDAKDEGVRKQVLRSFMAHGNSEFLVSIIRSETTDGLKRQGLRALAALGQADILETLYRDNEFVDYRADILNSLGIVAGVDSIVRIIADEEDSTLVLKGIESLGIMSIQRSGEALVSLYTSNDNPQIKETIIHGFFIQNNVDALVRVAKQEKSPHLKRAAIRKLSLMESDKAIEFFGEILDTPQ